MYFRLISSLFQEIKPNLSTDLKYFIVTDENVGKLYGKLFFDLFVENSYSVYLKEVPSGEGSKSRKVKENIEDWLGQNGCKKNSCILALGGGVVTDVTGFVAATYMRGIDYVAIPTTLMGMVDAAIGGKNGINTRYGKNVLGTIYFPKQTVVKAAFVNTLPTDEIKAGMMEIVKYGLVADKSLFTRLTEGNRNLGSIIKRCVKLKERIVKEDFWGVGLRNILNFGHTVAHALELLEKYTVSHGRALWFGLLVESKLTLEPEEYELVKRLLLHDDLNFDYIPTFDPRKIYKAMKKDKKNEEDKPVIVRLQRIGKATGELIEVEQKQFIEAFNEVTCISV